MSNSSRALTLALAVGSIVLAAPAQAAEKAAPACVGYGPQTPRDIDNLRGDNARLFPLAPPANEMNLCNIHFHANAEHKARDFSVYAGTGNEEAVGGGYQCAATPSLTKAQLAAPSRNACKDVDPGDTIEVHWVHTSCDIEPGEGLGACLSDACANPTLRVEAQVFLVVNDSSATNFMDYVYGDNKVAGLHQAKALPNMTGAPVEFLGSTTGPSFNEAICSPLQVSWSVRPQCATVDITTLSQWCESNVFEEDYSHGVRELVTNPALLAPIE